MRKYYSRMLVTVVMWAVGSAVVSASLIASDSFVTSGSADTNNGIYQAGLGIYSVPNKYVQGGSMVGFEASDWAGSSGILKANSTGLTSGGATYATGGSLRYDGKVDTTTRAVRHALDAYTGSSTYYVSMLMSSEILATVGSVYGGFNSGTDAYVADPAYGIFFGFAGNGTGMDLVIRQRESFGGGVFGLTNTVLAAASANTTYQLVAKIDVNANGSEEAVTVWLNPTSMSDTPVATFGTGAGVFSMQNDTSISVMSMSANNFGGGVSFDEMRLGTTWADVAVPEPATIGLLGMGTVLILFLRKRCRS